MLNTTLNLHSTFFNLIPLFLLLFIHGENSSVQAHIFIYASCSQEKYQTNSEFESNLNSFLTSTLSSSSESSYNTFSTSNSTSSSPDSAIYGLYQCRGDLKITDCSKCIQSSINQIGLVCPNSYGAALQLEGCFLRYERNDFLGKLDTSVKFKKCSESEDKDVEFFRRRDDVLSDLQMTASGFRVSSSGLVEGYAQCLGDLNSGDCSTCLANAVVMLKNLCGSAAAADVFLGQCYARYWASGYYDFHSDSSNEDAMGKTVAIIVGAVAAFAVLIVLLSFCRKAMG
ncbi:plasmodesmata-located protein 8 [Euphorbia peplus]|nr:plasmodesmata-located protein 8 [Euphorbia peplus]